MRRALNVLLCVLLCVAPLGVVGAQSPTPTQPRDQRVSFGVTVSRDTVTVGEPFAVRVRIRAPADARIRFPENPDTVGRVHARDPRSIVTADSVQWLDQIASYHVAAWDVGRQRVLLEDAVVTLRGPSVSAERRVPLHNIAVFVRSVLPADSALRVPKPARPLWETKAFPWWLVALLAAIAALAYWWWRRRAQPEVTVPPIAVDPYERAQREFDRIEAMELVDAGERTRFVALVVEVLRDYLAARHPEALLALTSRELMAALRRRHTVPLEPLSRVLHEADLAKFAGFAMSDERARVLARDARGVVEREHVAAHPPVQAAA